MKCCGRNFIIRPTDATGPCGPPGRGFYETSPTDRSASYRQLQLAASSLNAIAVLLAPSSVRRTMSRRCDLFVYTLHVGCSKFRVIIGLRKSRANIGECRRIFCRTYAKRKLTRGIFSSPRAWRKNLNGKKLAFSQIRPGNRRYQTSSPAQCCSMVGQFECVFLRRLYLTIMCSITSSTNRKCITYRNADTRGLTTTSSNIHTKFGVVGTGGARDMLADRQTRTCTQTRAA